MFLSDEPIQSRSRDRLDRRLFAEQLARSLSRWSSDESLVIALNGEWGTGKTSLLNMTAEALDETLADVPTEDRLQVIRFNPWLIADQEQLVFGFFRELAAVLGRAGSDDARQAARKLRLYATLLAPGEAIPYAAPAFRFIRSWLGKGSQAADDLANARETDLTLLRKELDDLLQKRPRTIVIIDDIDRLTGTEVRKLFQLVKLAANFPKVTYLLSFSRQVVVHQLHDVGVTGDEYLKKIVQVSFDVPPVRDQDVHRLLFIELDRLLSPFPEELDSERWTELFRAGLGRFFGTPRDVKRYVSSLAFHLRLLPGEVDPVDLIGIEALRVFLPDVHAAIASNKDSFTSVQTTVAPGQRRSDPVVTDVLAEAGQFAPVVTTLFPGIEDVIFSASAAQEWSRLRRACSPAFFERYFYHALAKGELSDGAIKSLIAEGGDDASSLTEALDNLAPESRVALVRRFADAPELVPSDRVVLVVTALVNMGDSLSPELNQFFGIDDHTRLLWATYALIATLPEDRRLSALIEALERSKSVFTKIRLLSYLIAGHEKAQRRTEGIPLSEADVQKLKERALAMLRQAAEDESLLGMPRLASSLYYWKELAGDVSEPKAFVERYAYDPARAPAVAQGFLSKSIVAEGARQREEWSIRHENVHEFLDVGRFGEALSESAEREDLNDSERRAIEIALRDLPVEPS